MIPSSSHQAKRRREKPDGDVSTSEHSEMGSLPSSPTSLSTPPPFSSSPVRDDDDDIIGIRAMDSDADRLQPEEEEGEDLFGPGMENDYKEMPHLDLYDIDGLDEDEYSPLSPEVRAAAETEMKKRDKELFGNERNRRIPAALAALDEMIDEEDDIRNRPLASRRRQRLFERELGDSQSNRIEDGSIEEFDDSALERLKELDGYKLREELTLQGYRLKFAKKFRTFLTTFVDEKGHSVYFERIKNLAETNGESLEVNYVQLQRVDASLAYFLANAPVEILKIFDEVAYDIVLHMFPDYHRICTEIHVRITDLPACDTLRDLRQIHLNHLIRVHGVVTRRTSVFPQLKYVRYDCLKCGAVLGPYYQDQNATSEIKIGSCSRCESRGPFKVNSEMTAYRNYQKITLQESPGTVPAGRLPRQKELILLWDLVDSARPGEEIEVTGIYKHTFDVSLNAKNGFPVFTTVIEVNHISKRGDLFASFRLNEDDLKEIRNLSKDERIGERIVQSIAPSIYGHEDVKLAVALAMFGGESKDVHGKHRIRGDINVLLLGDPGTAKSQILKYVEKTAHRVVYTTGQGASAVGLTASVRKDPVTREWTLEGGALVLADKGICLIDEFDKMNDADRTSIHEAMEQQSISISKAGIVTSLQARCSIIAAANPIRGRYDASRPFNENVDLTEPILSRFDILCVIKDIVDAAVDEQLARFVVDSHVRSHPEHQESDHTTRKSQLTNDAIPQDLLRKYIMYSKEKVKPKLQQIDEEKIARLYSELRRESLASGGIPITVRHVESMIRMAEAHARMHLRDYVRNDDIDAAIRVVLDSFIGAQKFSVMKSLRKSFARYITFKKDHFSLLLHILHGLIRETELFYSSRYGEDSMPNLLDIDCEELEARARELDIHDIAPFLKSSLFTENGYSLDETKKKILRPYVMSSSIPA